MSIQAAVHAFELQSEAEAADEDLPGGIMLFQALER